MRSSKSKTLRSLFRSSTLRSSIAAADGGTLISRFHTTTSNTAVKVSKKSKNKKSKSKTASSTLAADLADSCSNFDSALRFDNSSKELSDEISSILCGSTVSPEPQVITNEKSMDNILDIPWIANMSHHSMSLRRKEVSRERKQKWISKNTQTHRFGHLVKTCANTLGTYATIEVFGKLGRETGLKEYNALIGLCIEEARKTDDEDVALEQIYKAYQLFKLMRQHGFQIEEETYGPFLMYLIDMEMIEEFKFFCEIILDEKRSSLSRLGYYEMLFWITVGNEEKIQELCDYIELSDGENPSFRESYLLALCERDRKMELLPLLEIIDITKVSSLDYITSIFKSLGRMSLESFAEKFILAFKACDYEAAHISHFIFSYVVSLPNIAVRNFP